MKKNRFINLQKAQGMVEFALVLPILLLVILGIIGFGHLFFSYSSTVSASREAARFGSAVGVTGGGIPRYQDCDAIRAAAVRMGAFAGVSNTSASVRIQFDKGPGTTPTAAQCTSGGSNTYNPELGDRILITVVVPYRSIVPLVRIPSFNLTATTTRTIVRSLQIGEAPTAQPLCLNETTVSLNINNGNPSVVGQPVPMSISVAAASGPNPTIPDSLYIFDSVYVPPLFESAREDAPSYSGYSYTYLNGGTYSITGKFIPTGITYCPSALTVDHLVNAAATTLTIDSPQDLAQIPIALDQETVSIPVAVTLSVNSPGSRASWEGIQVVISSEQSLGSCTVTLNAAGTGSCSLNFSSPAIGDTTPVAIRADYFGEEGNYGASLDINDIELVRAEPVDTILDITVPDSGATFTAANGASTIPVAVSVLLRANPNPPNWTAVPLHTVNISSGAAACSITLNAAGTGSCTLTLAAPGAGVTQAATIQANYPTNRDYSGSTDSVSINLTNPAPPAPVCPFYAGGSINQSGTSLSLQFTNPATTTVSVTQVTLRWPESTKQNPIPTAKLDQLRFDWANTGNSCTAGSNAPNCLWSAKNNGQQLSPPLQVFKSITNGGMTAGYTYTMLFNFDYDLTTVVGAYEIVVEFDHSCPTRTVTYTR